MRDNWAGDLTAGLGAGLAYLPLIVVVSILSFGPLGSQTAVAMSIAVFGANVVAGLVLLVLARCPLLVGTPSGSSALVMAGLFGRMVAQGHVPDVADAMAITLAVGVVAGVVQLVLVRAGAAGLGPRSVSRRVGTGERHGRVGLAVAITHPARPSVRNRGRPCHRHRHVEISTALEGAAGVTRRRGGYDRERPAAWRRDRHRTGAGRDARSRCLSCHGGQRGIGVAGPCAPAALARHRHRRRHRGASGRAGDVGDSQRDDRRGRPDRRAPGTQRRRHRQSGGGRDRRRAAGQRSGRRRSGPVKDGRQRPARSDRAPGHDRTWWSVSGRLPAIGATRRAGRAGARDRIPIGRPGARAAVVARRPAGHAAPA